MEKYLTPIQLEQYQLHQQVGATTHSVETVFIVTALFIVVGLTTALIVNVLTARDKRNFEASRRKAERAAMSRRVEREINRIEHAKLHRETMQKNDAAFAKKFGSAR